MLMLVVRIAEGDPLAGGQNGSEAFEGMKNGVAHPFLQAQKVNVCRRTLHKTFA